MRAPRVRALRLPLLLLTVLLASTSLSACTDASPVTKSAATTASGTIGASGFHLSLPGVSATAPGPVASAGTAVSLSLTSHTFSAPIQSDLMQVGQTVRLALAKDEQPKAPITLRFKVDRSKVSKASWSTSKTFAIETQSVGSANVSYLPAAYDAKTNELVATTTHLSWFTPIQVIVGKYLDGVKSATLGLFKLSYESPSCAGQDLSASYKGLTYSTAGSWAVDPCLSADDAGLHLKLYSKTSIPFKVASTPAGTATTLPGSDASSNFSDSLFKVLFGEGHHVLLTPGAEVDYNYANNGGPIRLNFSEAPEALLLVEFFQAMTSLEPEGKAAVVAKLAADPDTVDCIAGLVDDSSSASTLSTQASSQFVGDLIRCVGTTLLDGSAAVIWSIVSSAPTLLAASGLGIWTELNGQGDFKLLVSQSGSLGADAPTATPAPSSSSATPGSTEPAGNGSTCTPGKLAVGQSEEGTVDGQAGTLIGGNCFDEFDSSRYKNSGLWPSFQAVNTDFCSKLGVEDKIGAVLGHGYFEYSTFNFLQATVNRQGVCTYGENTVDSNGNLLAPSVFVGFDIVDAGASSAVDQWNATLDSEGVSHTPYSEDGLNGELESTPHNRILIVNDGKDRVATVVVVNTPELVALLPSLAKTALAASENVTD